MSGSVDHARILSAGDSGRCLDTVQLAALEQSFRTWAEASLRPDIKSSRKRILIIFLLIRHTGARLGEVLHLDPSAGIDYRNHLVRLKKGGPERGRPCREVEITDALAAEIQETLDAARLAGDDSEPFLIDPGHVRRKFYERAEAVGIPRELGAPDVIRKSRAVELLQSNVPLPVVQRILGHSTPNVVASYVEFSDDEIREVAKHFVYKESRRKTSARNAFFGKIHRVRAGDVQSLIEIASVGGYLINAVITNQSLERLGLKRGALVMAEVKAPWLMLFKGEEKPTSTDENIFRGTVHRIIRGRVTTEVVVRIPDGTELCSVITEESRRRLDLKENDYLWVSFNAFAVVLHVE